MWNNASRSVLVQQYRQNRYTFITVVSLAVILLAFFITYAAFANEPAALPTLKQIHVIFRHGDRTPTYSYAKDPHKNLEWPEGRGALTRKGKHELFDLGETMRKRYDKFLGDTYHPDLVHMQSSYAPRCQMSGMTFYAGLFPPKGIQIWNPILLWQPIPVNPIPRSIDNLIAAKAYCKKFDTEKRKSDQELHASLAQEDQKIFEYLGQNTGEFITNISQAESIYYTLKIQRDNGLELPAWASEVFPAKLAKLAAINLASFTRTDTLKRLQTGPLLKEIVDHMKHRTENRMKAYFYSGHDLTVVSLMRTLGFDSLDLPEYGAALILEYHESDDAPGEGFIKVLYFKNSDKDKRKHNFFQMKLPFCEPDCLLANFVNGIFKYIPVDWQAECKSA